MNSLRIRALQNLRFVDPRLFLVNLRQLEQEVSCSGSPGRIKTLRTNGLREAREQRQAALFCYGWGERLGQKVTFAAHEDQDFDFVALWEDGDVKKLVPVQLKEVVPKAVNANATLESLLDDLHIKYCDSSDLVIVIYLNQRVRFMPEIDSFNRLKVASVWIFGAVTPDQSVWTLWGDFKGACWSSQFSYPV